MSDKNDPTEDHKQKIEAVVSEALNLEQKLQAAENDIMQNETFKRFIVAQKAAKENIESSWKLIETQMIEHEVKSIKGDWGSLTIAERLGWDIEPDSLAPRFIKRVPDTKKLSDTYRLEGKAPRGATPKYTRYLVRRIK